MKKIFLLSSLMVLLFANNTYSQFDTIPAGASLSEAVSMCSTNLDSVKYALNNNAEAAESGPDYGCLIDQFNPSWFYIKTTENDITPININIPTPYDLDYIIWGPFSEPTYNYDSLQADQIIDCDYGQSNTIEISIQPVVLDSYYMVMLTDCFSNSDIIEPSVISGTIECEINQTPEVQEYLAFPTENAIWVNTRYSIYVTDENPIAEYSLSNVDNFCVNGEDTVINEKNYTKVNYCEGEYKGALRDEVGIVYYCPKDSTNEYVLYDFTVTPGDTVYSVYMDDNAISDIIINNIDSVWIANTYRKRVYISGGGEWIEGIGCPQGLFMEPWGNVSFYELRLNCFSQNDTVLFPEYSIGSCSLTVGEEKIEPSRLYIYPNPAKSFVNIEFSSLPESNQIINIYAMDGSLKTSIINKEEQVQINTESWSKGVYFIQVTTKDKTITQKLLIQ